MTAPISSITRPQGNTPRSAAVPIESQEDAEVTGGGAPGPPDSSALTSKKHEVSAFVQQFLNPHQSESSPAKGVALISDYFPAARTHPEGQPERPPTDPPHTTGPPNTTPGKIDRPVVSKPTLEDSPLGEVTVRRGDMLSTIAPRLGVTWQQLYWENRDQISHPDQIQPGMVLRVPPQDLEVPDFAYTVPRREPSAAPHKGNDPIQRSHDPIQRGNDPRQRPTQRDPYQRDPYQRDPIQQSPIQQSPVQHSPSQRGSYEPTQAPHERYATTRAGGPSEVEPERTERRYADNPRDARRGLPVQPEYARDRSGTHNAETGVPYPRHR